MNWRFLMMIAIIVLGACERSEPPTAAATPSVTIPGVSTDDVEVRASATCWRMKPANYCESVQRMLDRSQNRDETTADILAREQRAVAAEARAQN